MPDPPDGSDDKVSRLTLKAALMANMGRAVMALSLAGGGVGPFICLRLLGRGCIAIYILTFIAMNY